jgi:histidinol dehydrogenase
VIPTQGGGPPAAAAGGADGVAAIVADVRARGDAALREWALRLDGSEPRRAEPDGELPEEALLAAAANVRRWHELQRPGDIRAQIVPGVELERRWTPLASVGLYVPRNLLSSLVMTAVPAQVAGVERIVVVTPPQGAGTIARAAQLLGLDEVWAVGGPHAIAALAYGTETIPRVDKIAGPGNAFVNEAKLLVSRDVAIDLPAGPSEVLDVAGAGADPRIVELELAAQAEHGPDSRCRAIELDGNADAALAEIEAAAPEHLVLLGEAEALAPRVRNAGAVFVGRDSPVAAGDYATGGNHVLPTGGWARSLGGLGIETFLKPVTIQRLTASGLELLRPTIEALALAEGMTAHAEAVRR